MMRRLDIAALPAQPITAASAFMTAHLPEARRLLESEGTDALAIILPAASSDHGDWRRTLARDLAREYAPRRVNVVTGEGEALDTLLRFLTDAPGVTGHYCEAHE